MSNWKFSINKELSFIDYTPKRSVLNKITLISIFWLMTLWAFTYNHFILEGNNFMDLLVLVLILFWVKWKFNTDLKSFDTVDEMSEYIKNNINY